MLRHADFQAVYQEGKKHFSANITAFYRRRNNGAGTRVGFTVGKVLGGAVTRNRIRRRMRAAVQRRLAEFAVAVDIVMHPRKSVLNMEFSRLEAEVEKILAEIRKGSSR